MGKIRTIGKKGDSLAVTIPPSWLREHGLSKGDRVDMTIADGSIIIRPFDAVYQHRAESRP